MKEILLTCLKKYLDIFPNEQKRQQKLIDYLNTHSDDEICDWNNFDGHVVAGGFIYDINTQKFLVLYHKDLEMFLYPGGHLDKNDLDPLFASKREIKEETGLIDLIQLGIDDDKMVPIDIDTHMIGYNSRLDLPEHYHFDFRYLFIVNGIEEIKMDTDELSSYEWIYIDKLKDDVNYGKVANKIGRVISNSKLSR